MAIDLVLEDGTSKTDSNTYITVAMLDAYDIEGTLSSLTEEQKEVLIIKASRKVESYRCAFQGCKTDQDQAMQFPRYDVYIDCYSIDSDVIPVELQDAQAQFAIDAYTTDLTPNTDGSRVIREKVDVLEVEYADNSSSNIQPNFNKAMALLNPLLVDTSDSWRG